MEKTTKLISSAFCNNSPDHLPFIDSSFSSFSAVNDVDVGLIANENDCIRSWNKKIIDLVHGFTRQMIGGIG
jgi:hypothetical protein